METKAKIESLLREKSKCEELERCLELYRRIDDFLEKEPTVLDKLKTAVNPIERTSNEEYIDYFRTDIPECHLKITVCCTELLNALRDYYEKKILLLTEEE
jgi:hypothetical protein